MIPKSRYTQYPLIHMAIFMPHNGTTGVNSKHSCNDQTSDEQEMIALKSKYICDGRYTFNICGQKYEVLQTTLQRYPNTLLADETRMVKFWDEKRQEYFLDHNRACFDAVLTYYQSKGIISRPHDIPESLFLNELEFYDLGDEVLEKFKDHDKQNSNRRENPERLMPRSRLQRRIWKLFEFPETSKAARCIAWLSCTVVLLSIVLFCIETLPQFREKDTSGKNKNQEVFFVIEAVCIAWFTFEYLTRLLSSPNKLKFMKEVLNVIDLVAILPFFFSFAFTNESNVSSMAILRIVRLVRVFRIFKLSRYSTGLQILGMTLRASMKELGLLVFFLIVGVVLFASVIYIAERSEKDTNQFKSIPHSFWWAIVTMTTVGYGDMYPTTYWGKLVGSLCACTGILAIALPVPVIVANFERFYIKSQQGKKNSKSRKDDAEKHMALKGLFDRLRRRKQGKHLDKHAAAATESSVISSETGQDAAFLHETNGEGLCHKTKV